MRLDLLEKLDGILGPRRWLYDQHTDGFDGESNRMDAFGSSEDGSDFDSDSETEQFSRVRLTRLTRAPSSRSRTTRGSVG